MEDDQVDDKKYMSSEEDEERYVALPANKSRNRKGVLLKSRRQKFCAKWELSFPWLKPDNVDESIGLCTVCNKRLVVKKSHLERHQKTYKHQRGMGFEDLSLDSIMADADELRTATEFLECGKQEPTEEVNDFDNAIEHDPDYSADFEFKETKAIKDEEKSHKSFNGNQKSLNKSRKLDRIKLLKRIDHDRQELNEFYQMHRQQHPTFNQGNMQPRDAFDLFFDSVSASVKTLPPKLASEVKNRVSQIITEYELRAICEREAVLENPSSSMEDDERIGVTTSLEEDILHGEVTHEAILTSDGVNVVPHSILYTFQPKLKIAQENSSDIEINI